VDEALPEIRVYEPLGPARKLPIVGLSGLVNFVRTKLATASSPILISGESGTGKNLLAEEIHDASPSRSGKFVTVLPSPNNLDLFYAGLLGRGTNNGLFQEADGGTIFFDEVDLLPLEVQSAVARILEKRSFHPFGSTTEVPLRAHCVAATRASLPELMVEGKFHAHFFFRLNIFDLKPPPLRHRRNEIPAMVRLFIQRYGRGRVQTIEPDVLEQLGAYSWPGNVRQLEHTIERMCALADGPCLTEKEFPPNIVSFHPDIEALRGLFRDLSIGEMGDIDLEGLMKSAGGSLPELLNRASRAIKKACIETALRRTLRSTKEAADLLGLPLDTFRKYRRGE
jgi:DNA-binding NtrC family response regulator